MFRLFVFDFVGESTLILPSQLAAFAGNDGLASIVLGGIMGSLYLWYLAYVLKRWKRIWSLIWNGFCRHG